MEQKRRKCPGCKRVHCEGCGIFQQLNTNKQISLCFPLGFQADAGDGLGISFDVGTTTLAGMLWDLKEGVLLAAETAANPQAAYGADVVSRIQAAVEDAQKAVQLQKILVKTLDEMAQKLLSQITVTGNQSELTKEMAAAGNQKEMVAADHIKKAVFVGNTAMCELLLGIRPEGIAGAPFRPDYQQPVTTEGRKLGFVFLAESRIIVLPPVGGYVGADALAVYSYIRKERTSESQQGQPEQQGQPGQQGQSKRQNWLAVDIGTNGEILLQCGEKTYACSTAAGPALEGGAVSCGMRAAAGAIDQVSLTGRFPQQDTVCHVIADSKEKGICGSGLIDALAVLRKAGVLEESGYLKTEQEARKAGVPERVCRKVSKRQSEPAGEMQTCFVLSKKDKEVYITQKDIRQLQLSIGAIRAGIETLLRKAGITVNDLGQIYLAGAFGSYINMESGIALGLFPDLSGEIYVQAGNLAGMGAAMALLSKEALLQMEDNSREIIHVELANEEVFQELFLAGMSFPEKAERIE